MLYRDGQKIDLTKEQKSELRKRFPKFPVVVKYDQRYITWDKVNKRDVFPPSISVPANGSIVDADGDVSIFRYAKRVTKIGDEPQYTPSAVVVNKQMVLNDTDVDLLGYLFFYCPFMTNGKLAEQAKKKGVKLKEIPRFQFENIEKEAELFIAKDMLKSTVHAYITNPALGVEEKDLRTIAQSMFIPDAGTLDINLLRKGLLLHVDSAKGNEGYEAFLDARKDLGNTGIKAIVSEAIDFEVIKFDGRGRKWYWLDDEGEKVDIITPVLPGRDQNDTLLEFLLSQDGKMDQLKESLKLKKEQ